MSFLAPLYIAGLAAVALPIIFHLIKRTPERKQTFSSLMFLIASPPRLSKRSRLTNILLLILEDHVVDTALLGLPGLASNDLGASQIFLALAATIRAHRLPISLFDDLLSAFRQDITVKRYAAWTDLLDYCRRSANPVGRLVLRVAGYDDARLDASSDALCTALQLTNFWQDLERDWKNGRIYVPGEERERAGAREEDLDAGRLTPEWRAAMRAVTARTRELFDAVAQQLVAVVAAAGGVALDRAERVGLECDHGLLVADGGGEVAVPLARPRVLRAAPAVVARAAACRLRA